MCNVYYCVISAWAFYYLFASFAAVLPWTDCGSWWNNFKCLPLRVLSNDTMAWYQERFLNNSLSLNESESPVIQFWKWELTALTFLILFGSHLQSKMNLLFILQKKSPRHNFRHRWNWRHKVGFGFAIIVRLDDSLLRFMERDNKI